MYSREIDGEVLLMAASGWTYGFTFVLFDYNTESMWLPVNVGDTGDGSCGCLLWSFAGDHAGRMLRAFPSNNTTWDVWVADHPDSKFMKTE
ncbi:MAG: DUF3179 domain-containing protein [Candidatus Zixiibacteriota bacterium]|nr:MAG: DUF3179 domain-containing protein [candidate division Zixibacteria bacterium]